MKTYTSSRRNTLLGLLCAALGSIKSLGAKSPEPKYYRVQWKKLHDEPVGHGDMWVMHATDPNTPDNLHFLEMHRAGKHFHGIPAKDILYPNGNFWRPVAIVDVN